MSETEVNIPLLRKAVEWAEAEAAKPEPLCEWNQMDVRVLPAERNYFSHLEDRAPECGTCYCIAGYVVAVGDPEAYERANVGICSIADRLLGLSDISHDLYAMLNSIEDVRRIAESIAGERL